MQNQSNTEQFLKLPYDLLATTSFVSSTGEIVEITLQQKVIYCWMKQRCEFFTRENKEYFDTLESVAAGLSIDRKTVMRAIDFFTKHGVLIAEKRKAIGTRQKWFFKRFNNLVLVQKENIAQKPSISPQVERSEESNTNAQIAEYVEPELAGEAWVHEAIPDYDYEYYEPSVDDQDMDSNYYNPEDLKEKSEKNVAPAPGKKSIFEPWMFTSKNLNSFKKGSEWDECLINFMLDSGIAEPYRVLTGGDDNDFSFMGDRYQFNARSGFIIPSELPF